MHVRQFDAADEKSVKEVVEHAVGKYGRLDVFYANAGITGQQITFTGVTEEEFMRVMKTNVLRWERLFTFSYIDKLIQD